VKLGVICFLTRVESVPFRVESILAAFSLNKQDSCRQRSKALTSSFQSYIALSNSLNFSTNFSLKNGLSPNLHHNPVSKPLSLLHHPPHNHHHQTTHIPSLVTTLYVPPHTNPPPGTTSPCPSTSKLPKISSTHALLPQSGGFLPSLTCTHPPLPAPPCSPAPVLPDSFPARCRLFCENSVPLPAPAVAANAFACA